MATINKLSILLAGFLVFGLLSLGSPSMVQAQVQVMGCCQFEGGGGGCWYPADKDACANMDGKYIEDAKCNVEITKCVENKKDDSSESGE